MRSRAMAAKSIGSTRRCPDKVDRGDSERPEARRERPTAPLRSTFRRVAVFVPLSASEGSRDQ